MQRYFNENTFHRMEKVWRTRTGKVQVKILDIISNECRADINLKKKVINGEVGEGSFRG